MTKLTMYQFLDVALNNRMKGKYCVFFSEDTRAYAWDKVPRFGKIERLQYKHDGNIELLRITIETEHGLRVYDLVHHWIIKIYTNYKEYRNDYESEAIKNVTRIDL